MCIDCTFIPDVCAFLVFALPMCIASLYIAHVCLLYSHHGCLYLQCTGLHSVLVAGACLWECLSCIYKCWRVRVLVDTCIYCIFIVDAWICITDVCVAQCLYLRGAPRRASRGPLLSHHVGTALPDAHKNPSVSPSQKSPIFWTPQLHQLSS